MANFNDFVEIEIPKKPFDKEFKDLKKHIKENKITSKKEIIKLINEYHEQYFKVVLSSESIFRFDFKTKMFIEDEYKYLKKYISGVPIEDIYDSEGRPMKLKSPLAYFEDFVTNNGWIIDGNKNRPQLFKEIEYIDGYKIETKYISIYPRIPIFLKENQKPYEEYDDKYKEWVTNIFYMFKHHLCSDNEKDFEYMKNWFINKALMKRNETSVVLQSTAQGTGKTTFSKLLFFLFDENSSLVEIGHECSWLHDKFNTQLKGKVLISIEEMPRLNNSKWHDASEKLKDYITNSKTSIEGKGENAKGGQPLFVDFVITANDFNVPLEGNDRRYFVPTVIDDRNDETNKLLNKINKIVGNDDGLSKKELREYAKCLYAYCVENYDEKFNVRKIPITDMLLKTNDKKMNLVLKYIKEFYLKLTNNIIKDDKTGEYYYKIFMKHLSEDLNKFIKNVRKNPEILKKYNYSEGKFKEFVKSHDTVYPATVSNELKKILDDEYFKKETKKENKNDTYLIISYNELLEKYKSKDLIKNEEYEELKEKIKTINNNGSNDNNNNNDNDNEELIHHKDIYGIYNELKHEFDKIKSENEKLKEKLEEFNSDIEMKNKELEKIKKELESKEPIKEPIKPKIEVLYEQNKKYIQFNYDILYENKHLKYILDSVGKLITRQDKIKQFEKIIKEPIKKDIEMIGNQQKQEKDLENIYNEINDLLI